MTDPAARSQNDGSQASLGDLVALAVSDVTQLVKFEVDLAKLELKEDARRLESAACCSALPVSLAAWSSCCCASPSPTA